MERDLFRAGVYLTLFQILQGLHIPLSDKFHTGKFVYFNYSFQNRVW
jgi:hypothetical protein